MKNVPAILIAFVLGASLSWAILVSQHYFDRQASASPELRAAITPPNFAAPTPSSVPLPSPVAQQPSAASFASQFREYHDARDKTLANNPDLAAEFKSLQNQIAAQNDALNAAMIKADPKVAPIIAKLMALRQQSQLRTASPLPPSSSQPPTPHT